MRSLSGVLTAIALCISGCVTIGETGKSAFLLTTPGFENKLGDDGYKEVLSQSKLNKDPKLNAMLQRVGKRIAAQTGNNGFQWEFNLIESEEVNAWCMPGGKVAFYTGILPYLKDEGGMAAVMGHEVAHATLRHSGQRISQGMLVNLGLSAADVSLSNSKYHDTILGMLGAGATVGVVLPYSRGHESEADVVGLKYMAQAGYDPKAAVEFWKRFSKASKGAPPEFLSTHPASSNRVAKLQQELPGAKKLYQASKKQFGFGETINFK